MTIGERIRERRRELGWTLKRLADETGLSLPYLSDVERGRTQPSVKTLTRIAAGLGLNVTDLMAGVAEYGEASDDALPAGLRELKEDPEWGPRLNDQWLQTLQRVNYKGRRPASKQDWLYVFMSLRSVFPEKQ